MMDAVVGRDESFDSLARHDTTTLQRAVMSPVQMPRPQQQLTTLQRQTSDANVTRCIDKSHRLKMPQFHIIFSYFNKKLTYVNVLCQLKSCLLLCNCTKSRIGKGLQDASDFVGHSRSSVCHI